MKLEDIFSNADEKSAERIAERYPVLSEDEKERLYIMSKRKYDDRSIPNTEFKDGVSGVEHYSRPKWHKAVSIAAAAVLVVGGLGGAFGVMSRNGNMAGTDMSEEVSEEAETTEAETEEVTEAEEVPADIDYEAIALDLTDRYLECENHLKYQGLSCDTNDSVTFYTFSTVDPEWSANYGGERTFYKVTDERFTCCQDIYDDMCQMLSEAVTESSSFEDGIDLYSRATLKSWLGGDVSQFENGSNVDLRPTEDSWDEAAYAVNNASYIDYNGSLYVRDYMVDESKYPVWFDKDGTTYKRFPARFSESPIYSETENIKIYDETENSFKVSRYVLPAYIGYENAKYGEEYIYSIENTDAGWRISGLEVGKQVEYSVAIGIQSYFEHRPEYDDVDIDTLPVKCIDVTSYDPDKGIAEFTAVLPDINGADVVQITGTASVSAVVTGLGSAEVTRLKDFDESLKRKSVVWAESQGTR